LFLILGLGNPGPQYELTRHNIGFLVADNLAEKHRIALKLHKHQAQYGLGLVQDHEVLLAKPLTYMNLSGRSAKALLSASDILSEDLIVIHDDIDLPLGKIKIKHKGGDGGQLGVRSIKESLRTEFFCRIRVGVGRPDDPSDIVDYVLSPFAEDETEMLNEVIELAIAKVESTLVELTKRKNETEDEPGC
jgi:PTH1 family peptidyl-tRNA hydrolase